MTRTIPELAALTKLPHHTSRRTFAPLRMISRATGPIHDGSSVESCGKIENEIKNTNVNKCSLEESLKLLTVKAEELSKLDLQIEELLDSDSFEVEFEASQDYAERINVWKFGAERKLNELTGSREPLNDNKHVVRLPN
ncbi:hypothetical protein AVEN_117673-1 [Araneus ventricosus]|uniref:Uncharacterized protein n=1 Tax=Araneus ventricosus TaxID=182803 RepID=A0A4Y2SHA3_ARAVE|nr:hypothetical protein AVEN_117673-1 [Araneus ventricosus]